MKCTLLMAGVVALSAVAGTAQAGGDAQAGKAKAGICAGCHGANGEGNGPNPPLAGKNEEQLIQAMKDYKSGKRPNPMMKTFAAQLSDQDTANVSAYYAALKAR